MSKIYHILRADPAGNITVFVLDDVPLDERPQVAKAIMKKAWLRCEQVGFICPPQQGGDGRMEMAGGEFCGNATRAYGAWLAKQQQRYGRFSVEVSGCDHPVSVWVDHDTAEAEMPLPLYIQPKTVNGLQCTLVHLGGIAHLVAEYILPDLSFFEAAEPYLASIGSLDAYGVIFLSGDRLTPLVKVPATGALIWEGSCGSGTVAAAIVQSSIVTNGVFSASYCQPDGDITARITRENGKPVSATIGGSIRFNAPMEIEL